MKNKGLIFSIVIFSLGIYLAYDQIGRFSDTYPAVETVISKAMAASSIMGLEASWLNAFTAFLNTLTPWVSGSLMAALMVLALLVELVTLYPSVQIQLKQKKIHLFHKKLVDRFQNGELTMGKARRELDILYAVNEALHRKGAWLVTLQLIVFVAVLGGLYLLSLHPEKLAGGFDSMNYALLAKPLNVTLPLLVALAYLLYSLIKIAVRQREDYISQTQINIALSFAVLVSVAIFFFVANFSTLLSFYLLTHLTFSVMRYLIVEEKAAQWGKLAQKELILALRHTPLKKNKLEHLSQKWNHAPLSRHLNLHLLEEGISMSFAFLIALTHLQIL